MPVFDTNTLLRFFNEGESEASTEYPLLVDRFSPSIVSGTSVYTLPDYVLSIRRVTYRGQKLDPMPNRNFREIFQSILLVGKPFWYIFNNIGQNKIQLFPTPPENLPAAVDLWGVDIPTTAIVEFTRVSDNNIFVLPAYIKRQLLKYYVAKQCFLIEGPDQNIKLSKYFDGKWEQSKFSFFEHLNHLHTIPRRIGLQEMGTSYTRFPGEPILPIAKFGISVDTGE